MIGELVKMMLGPLGPPAMDFMERHPDLVAAILLGWGLVILAAMLQLRRIEQETAVLVLREAQEALARGHSWTAKKLFDALYPEWCKKIKRWGWFIPHRLGLWPVRVSPENLCQRMGFSPTWVEALLQKHGVRQGPEERR